VLVEKKTDLMITAATKEAGALTKLASTWGDKASEEPILGFRQENIDQSIARAAAGAGTGGTDKAEMDAVARLPTALASGASLLLQWSSSEEGIEGMERRREACEQEVAVAVKRRAHEGRGAPTDPSKQLQRDWGEMTASMAQLHAKVDEMTRWQRRQLDTVQGALMTSRLKLGSQSHLMLHPGGEDADRADGRSSEETNDRRNMASPARSMAAPGTANLVEASRSATGSAAGTPGDVGKGAELVVEVKDEKKGGFCVLM